MHCMKLEAEYGIPTAPVIVAPFKELVAAVAKAQGMPMKFVFVPMPVMGKSPSVLRAYIDGEDPVTSKPVMAEIIETLVAPQRNEAKGVASVESGTPRLMGPDTEENWQNRFIENNSSVGCASPLYSRRKSPPG